MSAEDAGNKPSGDESGEQEALLSCGAGANGGSPPKTAFDAKDFSYSFLSSYQGGAAEAGPSAAVEDASGEPFSDIKYSLPADSGSDPDIDKQGIVAFLLCILCCCITLGALIVGALLLTYDQYASRGPNSVAGAVLVAVGSFFLLMSFFVCCAACGFNCSRGCEQHKQHKPWTFKRLNDQFEDDLDRFDGLRFEVGRGSKAMQEARKADRAKRAAEKKAKKNKMEAAVKADIEAGLSPEQVQNKRRPVMFKIVFNGDIYVSSIDTLRDEISLCIAAGNERDTVCVVLTSGGGAVTMYGLAAAQLGRVRKARMRLVVCVDSIAASGGYLMATMADEILAAPFALVGSIGVISIVPNVQKLLEKHDVNTYVFTAGKYKRTVDVIGEVTDEGKAKMMEELEGIHQVFKDHICVNRPALLATIDEVATGEAWLAIEGRKKGLVDEIATSDEFLSHAAATHDVIMVKPNPKRPKFIDDLFESAAVRLGWGPSARSARGEAMML